MWAIRVFFQHPYSPSSISRHHRRRTTVRPALPGGPVPNEGFDDGVAHFKFFRLLLLFYPAILFWNGPTQGGVGLFAIGNGNPYIAGYVNNGFANMIPSGLTPTVNASCSACSGRVLPNYGVIRTRDNSGHSSYNGLQTSYNVRNLAHQLTLTRSFTWSKTMDNITNANPIEDGAADSFIGGGDALRPFLANAVRL